MSNPIPGWLNQVNFVKNFFFDRCHTKWIVQFELAAEPAGEAIIAYFGLSATDVLRGYIRPKGLRTGRHFRRGRKSGRPHGGIPDSAEAVAEIIPGQQMVADRKYSKYERYFWILDGTIQRGLYYMMVADITIDFFAHWTSILIEAPECQGQGQNSLFLSRGTLSLLGLLQWQAVQCNTVEWDGEPGAWFYSGNVISNNDHGFTGTYCVTLRNLNLYPVVGNIGLVVKPTNLQNPEYQAEPTVIAPGGSSDFLIDMNSVTGDGLFTVALALGGNLVLEYANVYCK